MSTQSEIRPDALAVFSGVVFLDIDGVLNSEKSARRFRTCRILCPDAVQVLNDLCFKHHLGIVVSSTWRMNRTGEDLIAVLAHAGVERAAERYCGKTPDLSHREGTIWQSVQRGDEIEWWVKAAGLLKPYVILDDDGDMDAVRDHWVKVDQKVGLTAEDAARASIILEAK